MKHAVKIWSALNVPYWTENPIYLLMLMPSCQTTSVSSFKMQAAARKAQAS